MNFKCASSANFGKLVKIYGSIEKFYVSKKPAKKLKQIFTSKKSTRKKSSDNKSNNKTWKNLFHDKTKILRSNMTFSKENMKRDNSTKIFEDAKKHKHQQTTLKNKINKI